VGWESLELLLATTTTTNKIYNGEWTRLHTQLLTEYLSNIPYCGRNSVVAALAGFLAIFLNKL